MTLDHGLSLLSHFAFTFSNKPLSSAILSWHLCFCEPKLMSGMRDDDGSRKKRDLVTAHEANILIRDAVTCLAQSPVAKGFTRCWSALQISWFRHCQAHEIGFSAVVLTLTTDGGWKTGPTKKQICEYKWNSLQSTKALHLLELSFIVASHSFIVGQRSDRALWRLQNAQQGSLVTLHWDTWFEKLEILKQGWRKCRWMSLDAGSAKSPDPSKSAMEESRPHEKMLLQWTPLTRQQVPLGSVCTSSPDFKDHKWVKSQHHPAACCWTG